MKLTMIWYQRHGLAYLLWPLSMIFRVLTYLRRQAYRCKILKSHAFPIPVVIVGNISVGGTGKTPFIIYLADLLRSQSYQPGIVSRGYGAKPPQFSYLINPNDSAITAGDEPLLLARRTGCPVVIDPNRPRAVETLLREHDCDIILADDGLQHYALARDIEIIVIDGQRLLGNGFLLPAGPLRESRSRLNTADFLIINGGEADDAYQMKLKNLNLVSLLEPNIKQDLTYFADQTVHVVAGIGNPGRFFAVLRDAGLTLMIHEFADHHQFSAADVDFSDQLPVIMTEKDAVKCSEFANYQFWYLPVDR